MIATTHSGRTVFAGEADRAADCRNRVYRVAVAEHPGSIIIDLNAFVKRAEEGGRNLHIDFVHLSPAGGAAVSAWMLPQIQQLATGHRSSGPDARWSAR